MKNKILCLGIILLGTNVLKAQSTDATNAWNGTRFLGFNFTNGTNPLTIRTNNITRMHINGATGVTAGFIGVGTTNPLAPMHIFGTQQQNAQGWRRGIILGNSSALLWDGGGGQSFFMAHPSSSPNGNWYAGAQNGLNAGAGVDYAMTVSVNSLIGTSNPLRSTQFFKNLLVFEPTFSRRFGVNTQNPQLASEIYSNTTQMRLSYGAAVSTTTVPGVYTDFQTNPQGNLQIMPTGQRVGINLNANPTHNLDVNGDARIRNVQSATPDALFVGVRNAGNAGDLSVRRLDFTGNAGQVLLGNGTWGTAPTAVTANNGLSIAGGNVQLGAPCNSLIPLLTSSFTSSRALFLNGNSFWLFSGAAQNGGIGLGAQPASTGLCGVGNTVEISANNQSAYGNADASGLRFTKLTSVSPTVANGTNGVDNSKVLTVDQNGDVVLTDASPGGIVSADNGLSVDPLNSSNVQMGQEYTPGTLAFTGAGELIHYTEVPLREFDLVFSSDNLNTPGQSRISIGVEPFAGSNNANNNLLASAKLNTYNFTEQSGGHFLTYLDPNTTGMIIPDMYCGAKGTVLGRHPDKKIFGLYGQGLSQTNSTRVDGVRGEAYGSGINIGVSGYTIIGTNGFTRGGEFITREAANGVCLPGESVGVYGKADGSSTSNISVYGEAAGGIGCGTANNWAGYFNGDVYVSGVISGPSDATLKTNVSQINNGLDIINQLNPVNFEFDNTVKPRLNLETGIQYGLIAQEVELVLPELVGSSILPAEYDTLGNMIDPSFEFKTLNYEKFVPILIAGMQEQQEELDEKDSIINDLNNRLTQLENCLSGILPFLCQLNNSAIAPTQEDVQRELAKAIDVQLSDKNNIILNQNVPNPFAEKTVISYSIPETVGKAQIHFYDGKGTLINTVDIVERGSGEINVYANDLSSGVYTYSLVADGQIVSTKRMMKQ